MNIKELSDKIDKYHEENRDLEWRKLGLLAGGFALATTSLATADPKWSTIVIAVSFLIIGVGCFFCADFRKRKRRKK
jgi:hypothetical protein